MDRDRRVQLVGTPPPQGGSVRARRTPLTLTVRRVLVEEFVNVTVVSE